LIENDLFLKRAERSEGFGVAIANGTDVLKLHIGLEARICFHHQPVPAWVVPGWQESIGILFVKPRWAISPRQFAAYYRDDELLGTGPICNSS
jgi:tRNA U34 2-thiouridine synthase MnmA/TrmU